MVISLGVYEIKRMNFYCKLRSFFFVLMICYVAGLFSFDIGERVGFMDVDLSGKLEDQGGSSFFRQFLIIMFFFLSVWMKNFFYGSRNVLFDLLSFLKDNYSLTFVLLLFLISSVWSEHPVYTVKRTFVQILLALSLCFFVKSYTCVDEFIADLRVSSLVILFTNILVFVFSNSSSVDLSGALVGVHTTKNTAGMIFSVFFGLYIYLIYGGKDKRILNLFCAVAYGFMLIATLSKTAIVCAYFFIVLGFYSNYLKGSILVLLGLIFCQWLLVFLTILLRDDASNLLFGVFLSGVDLTGRIDIWSRLFSVVVDNFWFGVGYGAFWSIGEVQSVLESKFGFFNFLNSAHNGYLDILITNGFVGLLFLFFFLFHMASYVIKKGGFFSMYIFGVSLVYNFTESSFFRDLHFLWIIFLLVYFLVRKGEVRILR